MKKEKLTERDRAIAKRLIYKKEVRKSDLYFLIESSDFRKKLPLKRRDILNKLFKECRKEKRVFDCLHCKDRNSPFICPLLHLFPTCKDKRNRQVLRDPPRKKFYAERAEARIEKNILNAKIKKEY